MTTNTQNVLGTFSKGSNDNSAVSLNFCRAGGSNCDKRCPYNGNGCYAENLSKVYVSFDDSLALRETMTPAQICRDALAQLKARKKRVSFFRFSVAGSLPFPSKLTREDRRALASLVDYLLSRKIPIHCPVESIEKQKTYSRLFPSICVRRSAPTMSSAIKSNHPVSVVIGQDITGAGAPAKRVEKARTVLIDYCKKTGKRAGLCPGVKGVLKTSAKCAQCGLCSNPDIDLIGYVWHS